MADIDSGDGIDWSNFYSRDNYEYRTRGRSISGDIGWEDFPMRTESTTIYEDPDALYEDQRRTLSDFGPVTTGLFPWEEARRNVQATDKINLWQGGARVNTQPWKTEDFDTQFHDHDPRGWTNEQPWGEYKRQARARHVRTDFRDDSDYSVTGGGIHPNTMYKRIRSTQNELKDRMKIFDTNFETAAYSGVGIYPHVSAVRKSQTEPRWDNNRMADLQNINLSNIVHEGSSEFRANSTTDHKVPVAAYGKLYKSGGLTPLEHDLRLIQDETQFSKNGGLTQQNNAKLRLMGLTPDSGYNSNLTNYMTAQLYQDDPSIQPATAQTIARILMSTTPGNYDSRRAPLESNIANNRTHREIADILKLMGHIDDDTKFAISRDQSSSHTPTPNSDPGRAMRDTVIALSQMSPHERLNLKQQLIIANAKLRAPGDARKSAAESEVQMRIREFRQQLRGKNNTPLDDPGNSGDAELDSRQLKESREASGTTSGMFPGDVGENRYEADGTYKLSKLGEIPVAEYGKMPLNTGMPTPEAEATMKFRQSKLEPMYTHAAIYADPGNFNEGIYNHDPGRDLAGNRHGGRLGTKYTARYTNYEPPGGAVNEIIG